MPPAISPPGLSLGAIFVMLEIFAASVYSASANLALIALVESAWLAWIFASWMPIKIFI
ncbi:hypothetical protein [Candidatus Binatus sp.]|uniref:hypothetical protein n=1 Tax=Candidatus Binatus sp. TaxID=2811406 RepID=UPI0027298EFF|nr:hypothetical protein [Candidatus Binatus sp.]